MDVRVLAPADVPLAAIVTAPAEILSEAARTALTVDEQILALLARLKQPDAVREWFADMLRLWIQDEQQGSRSAADDIQRELTNLRTQQDRLSNLRLLDEIESDTFGTKNTELRDRIATLTLQLEASHRQRDEYADIAQKVFELSQSLPERWVGAEYAEKRQILEMLCLNFSLDGATLVPTMRSPFDLLIEGRLVSSSRGDRI
jgi:site-specific DNA recombinase